MANSGVEWLVESMQASVLWHIGRATRQQREWIVVQATSDGIAGQAWAPFSDQLRHQVETVLNHAGMHQEQPTNGNRSCDEAILARGLIETSELELTSRRHGVPLHLWLGGALRKSVRVTVPIVFRTTTPGPRGPELEQMREHIQNCKERLGITSFAIYDSSSDLGLIASSLTGLRFEAGLGATLTLRLAGQFDLDQTRRLCSRVRSCGLAYIADPCVSIAMAVEASRNRLPALGLSVWKYDREDLLTCLPETPPAVLLVDPLLEGGPKAVRKLASIARVLQSEICLTAEAGGTWLTYLCAEVSAVAPAAHQPVQLPAGLCIEDLRTLGISSGTLQWPDLSDVMSPETSSNGAASHDGTHPFSTER